MTNPKRDNRGYARSSEYNLILTSFHVKQVEVLTMESLTLTDDTFSAQDEYGNDVFMLITNSQDIRSNLATVGRFDIVEYAGLLYVKQGAAEISEVWYSARSNPDLGITVYQVYPCDPDEIETVDTVHCAECNSLNGAEWGICYNCRAPLPEVESEDDDEYSWLKDAELLLDGAHGIYIPQFFAELVPTTDNGVWSGITPEDLQDLSDPDNEYYWDTWERVTNNATFVQSETGQVFTIHQDQDLWLVPA